MPVWSFWRKTRSHVAGKSKADGRRQGSAAPGSPSVSPTGRYSRDWEKWHSHHTTSVEDITALPRAKEIATGLHRTQSRQSRRSANDPALPRRKSTKKKKKRDPVREQEVRSMAAPVVDSQRRSTTLHGGVLRQESNAHRRQASNTSLPLEESIHSSRSGGSETRAYRVSALDVFSPRPTIRYSIYLPPPQASGGIPAATVIMDKSELWKDRRSGMKSSRINELADELDSAALRDILERDQRRRDKRRKADEERLRRKLERKAAKQQAAEKVQVPKRDDPSIGLGIGEQKEVTASVPSRNVNSEVLKQTTTTDELESQSGVVPGVQTRPVASNIQDIQHVPSTEAGTGMEGSVDVSNSAITSTINEPSSKHTRGPSNISQLPGLLSETYKQVPDEESSSPTGRFNRRRSTGTSSRRFALWRSWFGRHSPSPSKRGSSHQPLSEASFSNTSRESMARQAPPPHLHHARSSSPSKADSQILQQQQVRASGFPCRTRSSRFREDLPEFPQSPSDSRIDSPEPVPMSQPIPIRNHGSVIQPQATKLDVGSSFPRGSLEDLIFHKQNESPIGSSVHDTAGLMSQSLASVDSEGSWLSGKPVKRRSQQTYLRSSIGSNSVQRQPGDASVSHEELGAADDEYFRRLSPQLNSSRRSTQSGDAVAKKSNRTSPVMDATSDTEEELQSSSIESQSKLDQSGTLLHGDVSRHPTIIHREPHAKSTEALVNFLPPTSQAQSSIPPHEVQESGRNSPVEDSPNLDGTVKRATSIDLGTGHARKISAGSVKLLNLTNRQSVDSKLSGSKPSA